MIDDFDLIVFDWDGTLVDSIDWIVDCIQVVADDLSLDQPSKQACKDIIGLNLSEAMLALFPNLSNDEKKSMVASYRTLYLAKGISSEDLFLDALPVLHELKNLNKTLAVATGKSQTGLDRGLDGTGVRSFFDHFCCGDIMQSKPNPHMLFDIMEKSGVSPNKTLMVGDSTLDLIMAQNACVASIGVSTGAHSREALAQYNPIACIDNLKELLER